MAENKRRRAKQQQQYSHKATTTTTTSTTPHSLPRVSVCTPTGDRPHFLSQALRNVLHQTYPRESLEWVLVDDSTTAEGVECARRIAAEGRGYGLSVVLVEVGAGIGGSTRIPIGRKRNLTHEHSSGTFLVYMDDDDYYPPSRVEHAVSKLQSARRRDPSILLAGSSEIHIWFLAEDVVYRFGPHGPRHATAATLAFHRDLVAGGGGARFDDEARGQEEPFFLRDFTLPMVQLDPYLTILAITHRSNTVDRHPIIQHAMKIDQPDKTRVARTSMKASRLLKKDRESIAFYAGLRLRMVEPLPGPSAPLTASAASPEKQST